MKAALIVVAGCSAVPATHRDGEVVVDRFSARAGHLMVRSGSELPGPGAPIDFDRPPFVTHGLGPDGVPVRYYNFDVQPDAPATLYRVVRDGQPVAGQLDIVDVLPGDPGYSDFWRISTVEAPGPITTAAQARALHPVETDRVVDCPIVPRGSTAREGHGVTPPQTVEVWYRGTKVTCLMFAPELALDGDRVPTSPIYVTFGGREFRTEVGARQTHNVVASLPGDTDYSPLWAVHVYDPSAFDRVHDASSAQAAPEVKRGPHVNCPIVSIGAR